MLLSVAHSDDDDEEATKRQLREKLHRGCKNIARSRQAWKRWWFEKNSDCDELAVPAVVGVGVEAHPKSLKCDYAHAEEQPAGDAGPAVVEEAFPAVDEEGDERHGYEEGFADTVAQAVAEGRVEDQKVDQIPRCAVEQRGSEVGPGN